VKFWTGGGGRRLKVQKRAWFNTHAASGFIGWFASDLWQLIALQGGTFVGKADGLDRSIEAKSMSCRDAIFFLETKDGFGVDERQENGPHQVPELVFRGALTRFRRIRRVDGGTIANKGRREVGGLCEKFHN
jgi:hypothetical protein